MKISTDGRCPDCGSYRVDSIPSPRQARCLNCAEDYIRLTGGEALQWRKAHPYNDGIFVDAPDATPELAAAPGSASSLVDLAQRGELMAQIGGEIQESATRFAAAIGRLRASMDEVSSLLRTSSDGIQRMADGMRYDEPRGVRHALDVHANLLRDLADELDRPGQTKYSPTGP